MFVLIGFAFLAGVVTILSPCILPVLPIVLTSSMAGGRRRPLGVITGFVLSFTLFTLGLTALVKSFGISPDSLRVVAVIIILFFGVSMLIPQTQIMLEKMFSKLSGFAPSSEKSTGFKGGLLVGISLGLIWTPCAGPILASVITLAATSTVTFEAILITLAYAVGTSIPMVAIIYGGRELLNRVPFLLKNSAKIQKVFGVVIILVAIAIHFNIDRKFQAYILEKLPNYGAGLTKFEEADFVKQKLEKLNMPESEGGGVTTDYMPVVKDESGKELTCNTKYGFAPGFEEGGEWLNSPPLKLEELRGKVVLVDFWTYTCINCIRTLPYLNGWHEKYADDGLVIVGVHTPEFPFEEKKENVAEAIKDFDIKYPVVQDNDYKIWQAYENHFWPAKYFVDKNSCIREAHFGEGGYEESEKLIQELLAETGVKVSDDLLAIKEYKGENRSPETYLGYERIDNFASPEKIQPLKFVDYSVPEDLAVNDFAYGGQWEIGPQHARTKAGSTLEFNFVAKEVYLVMRSDKGGKVKVYVDGEVAKEIAGEDVKDGVVEVMKDRLYKLIKLGDYESHRLKLEFLDDGIEVFAFTFG